MSTPTSPGWYDDPDHADQLRYFDGVVWTAHVAPRRTRSAAPAQAPVPPPPAQPGGGDPYGWSGGTVPPAQDGGQWQSAPPAWGNQQWQQPMAATGPATPDGVPLAGWWSRVGAYIIDMLIVGVLTAVAGGYFLMRALRPWTEDFLDAVESGNSDALNAVMENLTTYMRDGDFLAFIAISSLVGLIYHVGFLSRFGATPGKMALRISVRERDRPGPPSPSVALRRYLPVLLLNLGGFGPGVIGLVASLVALADVFWPLWDPKRQALHDKIAGTNVVLGKAAPRR